MAVKAIDQHKRERLRQSIRRLETLVGEVEVQRTLYQGDGIPYVGLEGVFALPEEVRGGHTRPYSAVQVG